MEIKLNKKDMEEFESSEEVFNQSRHVFHDCFSNHKSTIIHACNEKVNNTEMS